MEDSPMPNQRKESGVGPMVATIIIVLVLAIGGVYFFITQQMKLHEQQQPNT